MTQYTHEESLAILQADAAIPYEQKVAEARSLDPAKEKAKSLYQKPKQELTLNDMIFLMEREYGADVDHKNEFLIPEDFKKVRCSDNKDRSLYHHSRFGKNFTINGTVRVNGIAVAGSARPNFTGDGSWTFYANSSGTNYDLLPNK